MEQQHPHNHHHRPHQQVGKGFSMDLASQALAATGSKSTLKATEWILNQRRSSAGDPFKLSSSNSNSSKGLVPTSQSKMDHFFHGGNAALTPSSHHQPISRTVPFPGDHPVPLIKGNPESRALVQQEPEADQGLQSQGAGGGRAGLVGGLDSKTGAALGWRSANSAHPDREQEDMGSSGYAGGGIAGAWPEEPRYILKKGASSSPAPNEDPSNPSSMRAKRIPISPPPGEAGAGPKRLKSSPVEGTPLPIFPTPPHSTLAHPPQHQIHPPNQNQAQKPGRNCLAPLAERMRPAKIDDVVGQDHLLAPGHILRTLLNSETVPSIILYGPPGTGKTSLARAIARTIPVLRFVGLSAVNSGTKEVKEVVQEAKRGKKMGQRTVLFLDEVHRFNRVQQDLFLPSVEAGHIIFIGATTENPSFEINPALRSRCQVLTLHKLEPKHLRKVLERAIADRERGVFASLPEEASSREECVIKVEEEALNFLANAADGDARVALNAIEAAAAAAYSETKLQFQSRVSKSQDCTVLSVRIGGLERLGSVGSSTVVKKEVPGPSGFVGERSANGFGFKRLEALRENAKESANSNEDCTKPFKRFVGGKEVTPVQHSREVVPIGNPDSGKAGLRLMESAEAAAADEHHRSNPDAIVPDRVDLDLIGPGGIVVTVTLAQVREAFQRSHILYDKTGEEHYNIISALHKSMRGGDADAAIYWLARMLEGGEGPLYVARRLVRFASEDVGLADPQAMVMAVACYQACHFLGMPECNVNLAQCVVYLALAPKSVVIYNAIEAAQKMIKGTQQNEPVPLHLRNAPTQLMKEMGYGKGYVYPPGHVGRVEQEYMPPSLQGHKFLQWPEL